MSAEIAPIARKIGAASLVAFTTGDLALLAMSYDNPTHRPVLEAEGLRQRMSPHEAYAELREASAQQGFLKRP
jgi:hypothetical protein